MSFEFQDFETLVEIPGEGQVREEFPDGEAPELTSVCVLSEPPEPWRFGVSFWVAEDREHGRGLQFAATETGGYTVVEYGGAEVAFY